MRALASSEASRVTIARMMKYGVLPGSAVVVLALAVPGFSLGAGGLVDQPFQSGATAKIGDTSRLAAKTVTVPVSSALSQPPSSAAQFQPISNGLAMPAGSTLGPTSSREAPALVPVAAAFAVDAVVAPDIEMQAATLPPMTAPVALEGGPSVSTRPEIEVLTAAAPELVTPALTEISIAALSNAPIEMRTLPLTELASLPMPLDDAIELPPGALDSEETTQIADVPAVPVVQLTIEPAGAEPVALPSAITSAGRSAALQSASMAPPVAETADLLPPSDVMGVQSATVSNRAPAVSRSLPEPAPDESAQLAIAPAARVAPGLAGGAPSELTEPAAPVPALKTFDPAETASLASVIDPTRPATLPPSASASPFDLDIKSKLVTRIDGQVAGQLDFQQTNQALSVRLGSIVELLKDRYDMGEFERITASSASDLFVSMHQLRDAGVPITYDPVYDEFNVGSRDHRPAAAHKVQIDQISTPEYGRGPATMEQVRP